MAKEDITVLVNNLVRAEKVLVIPLVIYKILRKHGVELHKKDFGIFKSKLIKMK